MSGSRLSISTERPEQRDVVRSLAISFVCPNKFKASRRIQSSAILVGASAVLGHPSKSDKFDFGWERLIDRAVQGRSAEPITACAPGLCGRGRQRAPAQPATPSCSITFATIYL